MISQNTLADCLLLQKQLQGNMTYHHFWLEVKIPKKKLRLQLIRSRDVLVLLTFIPSETSIKSKDSFKKGTI